MHRGGVTEVQGGESGYAGGTSPNPNYQIICSGKSDHAEVVSSMQNI